MENGGTTYGDAVWMPNKDVAVEEGFGYTLGLAAVCLWWR